MKIEGAVSGKTTLTNFGGNLRIQPQVVAAPRSEQELLELMADWRGKKIRAVGRLHSWSDAPSGDEVVVDLRHLNQVIVEQSADGPRVTAGSGCQIKQLLAELSRQGNLTLPSLGLISEQSIAGAISTGTHGSGKHCLSHYVTEVRVAIYDQQTGKPAIRTITGGNELRAAKCAVGCMGIVVSVKMICRPAYAIEEHSQSFASLDEVLAAEQDFPLQQFFFLPWLWRFVAQHRREVAAPRSRLAWLYRLYWFATIDVGLHLALKFMVQWLRSPRAIKFFYRRLLLLFVIRNWRVVDDSSRTLIMEHELFRHIEIEVFVRKSKLPAATRFVHEILECFSGNRDAVSSDTQEQLNRVGLLDSTWSQAGSYTHHYAICIRRVLPDDTLISMSSGGDEPYYALSFISYARPSDRDGFFGFAKFLAQSMAALFDARPHWGKVCPLDAAQVARLYPELADFQKACQDVDPDGIFRNFWAESTLFSASYF